MKHFEGDSAAPRGAGSTIGYRTEIDGLRAIAVLGVLLFHAGFHAFTGGYAGVDVFFVISGYLITRNILIGIDAGRFSYVGFFVNRVRRLYPALLVTIAISLLVGALLFPPPHMFKLAESAIASVLAIANIYFWSKASYWDIDSALKPLLHIWSLSVEEQFYFIWPPLLVLVSRASNKRVARLVLLAMLGVASLIGAGILGLRHPNATFYWMPWRAFEFMIGAAVIWLEVAAKPQAQISRELMAAAGFGMIAVSFVAFTGTTPFPFPGALLPCIGGALIIWAGEFCQTSKLWTNRLMVGIGRISYSLYLVHWPLIIFYTYWIFVPPTLSQQIGLVVGSFALALPLNVLVEKRFRRSRIPAGSSDARFLGVCTAVAIGMVAIAMSARSDDGWPWRIRPDSLNAAILAKLSQPVCRAGTGLCDAPGATAALIGDSHADHFTEAVAQSLQQAGVHGTLYRTIDTCALMQDNYTIETLDEVRTRKCRIAQQAWRDRIEAENPSLVILSSWWLEGVSNRLPSRYAGEHTAVMPDVAQSRARFERKITETVDWLTASHRKVVIIGPTVMVDRAPSACYGRPHVFTLPDCGRVNVVSDLEAQAYLTDFFRGLAAGRPDVLYVDVAAPLCNRDQCRLGESDTSFYVDRHHLTQYGAMWIQDQAFQALIDFARGSAH